MRRAIARGTGVGEPEGQSGTCARQGEHPGSNKKNRDGIPVAATDGRTTDVNYLLVFASNASA